MVDSTDNVPAMDHQSSDSSPDVDLADILAASPIMKMVTDADESHSEEFIEETDEPEYLDDSGEDANEEDNEEAEDTAEEEDEDEGEDSSTQDSDDSEEGDIDWEFEVPIKVDGEESNVSLQELQKGYQTQKHLSNQGRKLGEERKAFDEEQKAKLEEISGLEEVINSTLMSEENAFNKEYNDIKDEIKELRKAGDKFGVSDKKDELEVAQENYWKARTAREEIQNGIAEKQKKAKQKEWDEKVKDFGSKINDFVPNFNEKTATDVRSFAIEQGIPEAIIDQVTSPEIVKLVNDFRLMSEKLSKGTAKRKKVPARKATPIKRNPTGKQKAKESAKAVSERLASGSASEAEGESFLKGLASRHFK